jgi:hypothetical protein
LWCYAGARGVEVESAEVDDVAIAGASVRFEARERHEGRFFLRD